MSAPWPPPTVRAHTTLPGNFWRQWTASVISNLGDGIDAVAMPLLLLSLTGDERVLALAVALSMGPWILLALPLGVIVDRRDRRRLMVLSNVLRVGLFTLVALGAAGQWLSAWQLIALLVVIGVCEVLFDSSAQAFLPLIVEPGVLPRANGLLASAEFVAGSLVGIAIGAFLFDIAVGLPFGVNAATFAIAAVLTRSIRVRRRLPDPTTTDTADAADTAVSADTFRAGLTWLRHHRPLRTLAEMLALTNLGLMLGQGVYAKYAIDELGLDPSAFGLLLAITAIGASAGGLIAGRVVARVGMRTAIVMPYLAFVAGNVVLGASRTAWLSGVAAFCLGAAITVWNVVTITLRQQQIPTELFGRVNAVFRWVAATACAISIAAGGVLAHATTVRMPFIVGALISLTTIVLYGRRALRGLEGVG
jgi:MFS family permease